MAPTDQPKSLADLTTAARNPENTTPVKSTGAQAHPPVAEVKAGISGAKVLGAHSNEEAPHFIMFARLSIDSMSALTGSLIMADVMTRAKKGMLKTPVSVAQRGTGRSRMGFFTFFVGHGGQTMVCLLPVVGLCYKLPQCLVGRHRVQHPVEGIDQPPSCQVETVPF